MDGRRSSAAEQTLDPRDPEGRREAILRAALELFAERGFYGTAVPAIADRAGVGAGTVYRNFASKEELVNVLYRRWKQALVEHMLAGFPAQAVPRVRMAHFWRAYVSFAQTHPEALRFTELHHHGDYLDGESIALRDANHRRFVELVEAMQAEQALRDDVAADVLIAVVEGVFTRLRLELVAGVIDGDSSCLEQAERCVWEAIRA